ncbi:hypothetical protein Poly24_17160 [Rosistilla carotiformis]|uniref:Uncharacterized protein n=1 Tax=Rosistilla carotiformis TaxID=2528017 RepID=A0A518JR34_9BACT|nr:hypothetical protein [Rosistilla carotiformis]QDV68010.1 hypothetical protein Poly24_17160 [Rosistilla carotiformis]
MENLNIAGAIASIGAAIFACWQAYSAKNYRDEIQTQRTKQLLIELLSLGNRARSDCRKIGTQISAQARGVDRQAVLDVLREFSEKFRDNLHRFKSDEISKTIVVLLQHITKYASTEEESKRRETADEMYDNVSFLIADITRRLDSKL